jgi:hypothetical protein
VNYASWHDDVWGNRGKAPLILNLGNEWEWSSSRPVRFMPTAMFAGTVRRSGLWIREKSLPPNHELSPGAPVAYAAVSIGVETIYVI